MEKNEKLETPYRRAKQEWDSRMGDSIIRARAWRRMSVGLLLICGILSFGTIYYASQPRNIPYIIEINNDGEAVYKGNIGDYSFSASEKNVRYYLKKFIEYTRTLSSDVVVVKKNWLDAYFFLTPSGGSILNTYARDMSPLTRYKDYRIDIRFSSILEHSQFTRQVNWYEFVWNSNGKLISQTHWRGIFKYEFRIPSSIEHLEKNPLGFFIDTFNWTEVSNEP